MSQYQHPMTYYTDPLERRAYADAFARQSFPVFVIPPARADHKLKADLARARRIERSWRDAHAAQIQAGEQAPDYAEVARFAHRIRAMLTRAEYRWSCRIGDVSADLENADARWWRAYVDAWSQARMDGNLAISRVLHARREASLTAWGLGA